MRLSLRPSIQFRGYEDAVDRNLVSWYTLTSTAGGRYEVCGDETSAVRLILHGARAALTLDEKGATEVPYEMERSRGYESVGSLWSPGYFRADLRPDRTSRWSPRRRPGKRFRRRRPPMPRRGRPTGAARLLKIADCVEAERSLDRRSWCWRPTSSSSRPPDARRKRRAPGPRATKCGR